MSRADIDNPDQRMTEDVKTFTTITLSFLLMLLNATITASAFSRGPLADHARSCSGVAVGYAIAGLAPDHLRRPQADRPEQPPAQEARPTSATS